MTNLVTTAEDILNVKDLREERVFVEQWDREVIVREFSGRELQKVLALGSFGGGGEGEFAVTDAARVCAIAIKDENGKRVFTDEQAEELADKSMSAIMFVFNAALRISGMTVEEQEAEKNG